MRTSVYQLQQSAFPQVIGACQADLPTICAFANEAQQRLIPAMGETGPWGGWRKIVLQASRCAPYVTLPREVARIIEMSYCRMPVGIRNEFYELMEASIGLQDFCRRTDWCGAVRGYERGTFPSMRDVDPANQFLRLYATDPRDYGKRLLVGPAQDQNGNGIYTQDSLNQVNGFYLTLKQPFDTSQMIVSHFTGILKDPTFGDVLLYQVDATTGAQVLLSRYAPDEISPSYRRYFLSHLPCSCNTHTTQQSPCITGATTPGVVQVTAIAKLEPVPVNLQTDFLVIGNIPALIEEAKSIRFGRMDTANAITQEAKCHARAIKLLNDELVHYTGRSIAVNIAPFGTAKLNRVMWAVRNG